MPPFFRTLIFTIVGLATIALAWEAAALAIDSPTKLPAMSVVVKKAIALTQTAD